MIDPVLLDLLVRMDPKTSKLYWRQRSVLLFEHCKDPEQAASNWNLRFAGKEAFATPDNDGYLKGKVRGKTLYAVNVRAALARVRQGRKG